MPLIYCDHNYVVTTLQAPDTYRAHAQQLAATGTVTFVLALCTGVKLPKTQIWLAETPKQLSWTLCTPDGFSIDEAFNAEKWPRYFSII